MRQSLTVLNYKQNGYVQNTKTTQMILHYYHNIPDQRPSQKWFDGIILLVKKFYGIVSEAESLPSFEHLLL